MQHIGTAPIATAFVGLCGAVAYLVRYIFKQHEETRVLVEKVTSALSTNAAAMTAAAASQTAAREAMQIAAAVMSDREKRQ